MGQGYECRYARHSCAARAVGERSSFADDTSDDEKPTKVDKTHKSDKSDTSESSDSKFSNRSVSDTKNTTK